MVKLIVSAALLTGLCYATQEHLNKPKLTTGTCNDDNKSHHDSGFYNERTQGQTVKIDGEYRHYAVWIPPNYSRHRQSPLIFDFHGAHSTSTEQYENSMYDQNLDGQNYLIIYPLAHSNDDHKLDRTWQGAPGNKVDDFTFVRKLLAKVQDVYCVDSTRIFASGKSQGGGLVDQLACDEELGNNFAAFAMASPALYKHDDKSQCTAKSSRKIVQAHGSADEVIPYMGCPGSDYCKLRDEDVNLPAIPEWVWWWASAEGYTDRQPIDEPDTKYGHVTYASSSSAGIVEHYHLPNNGHCWPQTQGPPWNTDYTKSMQDDDPDFPRKKPLTFHHNCHSFDLDFTSVVIKFFQDAVPQSTAKASHRGEL